MLAGNVTLLGLTLSRSLSGPFLCSSGGMARMSLDVRLSRLSHFADSFIFARMSVGLGLVSSRFSKFGNTPIKILSSVCGSDMTVTGCVFVNCIGASGGAIYRNSEGGCSISDCNFLRCEAEQGGAVCCESVGGSSGEVSLESSCFVGCVTNAALANVDYGFCAHVSGYNLMKVRGVTCSDCDVQGSAWTSYCFVGVDLGRVWTQTCNFTSPRKSGYVGFLCARGLLSLGDSDVTYTSCSSLRFLHCHYVENPAGNTGFNPRYCQYYNMTFDKVLVDMNPACFVVKASVEEDIGTSYGMLGFGVELEGGAEMWEYETVNVHNEKEIRTYHHLVVVDGSGWFWWEGCFTDHFRWSGGIALTEVETAYEINPDGEAFCQNLPTNPFTGSASFTMSETLTTEEMTTEEMTTEEMTTEEMATEEMTTKELATDEMATEEMTGTAIDAGDSNEGGISDMMIGIIVGVVVGIVAVALVLAYIVKRSRMPRAPSEHLEPEVESSHPITLGYPGGLVTSPLATGNSPLYEEVSTDPFEMESANE